MILDSRCSTLPGQTFSLGRAGLIQESRLKHDRRTTRCAALLSIRVQFMTKLNRPNSQKIMSYSRVGFEPVLVQIPPVRLGYPEANVIHKPKEARCLHKLRYRRIPQTEKAGIGSSQYGAVSQADPP